MASDHPQHHGIPDTARMPGKSVAKYYGILCCTQACPTYAALSRQLSKWVQEFQLEAAESSARCALGSSVQLGPVGLRLPGEAVETYRGCTWGSSMQLGA